MLLVQFHADAICTRPEVTNFTAILKCRLPLPTLLEPCIYLLGLDERTGPSARYRSSWLKSLCMLQQGALAQRYKPTTLRSSEVQRDESNGMDRADEDGRFHESMSVAASQFRFVSAETDKDGWR